MKSFILKMDKNGLVIHYRRENFLLDDDVHKYLLL